MRGLIAFVERQAGPSGGPHDIWFDNGNRAQLWLADGISPGDVIARLALPPAKDGRPVVLVCGGADDLKDTSLARATAVLGPAVAAAARAVGAAVADGGTSAGVMAIMGAARAWRPRDLPVLLGVAPAGAVAYPGGPGDGVPLEHNHTHFVLADSAEWGDETPLLFSMAEALAGGGRVAVVLAGGGPIAKAEVAAAVRHGWPVFAVGGTEGFADSLIDAWTACHVRRRRRAAAILPGRLRYGKPQPISAIGDDELRKIVQDGDIRPFTGDEPGQLGRQIAWELQDEPVLKDAWRGFATYDRLAARQRATFSRLQVSILVIGVVATGLALVHEVTGGAVLHWAVLALPVTGSVLIALAARQANGQRWVLLRAAAQAIKAEIYRYRTRTGAYGNSSPAEDGAHAAQGAKGARGVALAAQIDIIVSRLMQTDASTGPLTPYDGPLPPEMYGAGRDDDGLSPLDMARYLEIRVVDQLNYYAGRVGGLNRRRYLFQLTAIAASGAGAILAAAGFEVWIGLTAGMSAAAFAYLGYLQVDNTIVAYNQAAGRLRAVQLDWRARQPDPADTGAFADLVRRSEEILTAELAGWVQQMNDALRELKDQQADAAKRIEPGAGGGAG